VKAKSCMRRLVGKLWALIVLAMHGLFPLFMGQMFKHYRLPHNLR